MKKSLLLLSIIGCSTGFTLGKTNSLASKVAAPAASESKELAHQPPLPSPWHDHSQLDIGGIYSYAQMQPKASGCFHGNLSGAQAQYAFKPSNFLYEALTFKWKQGETKHNLQTRFLLDFDVQERIGYTFGPSRKSWALSLFTGLGFRYLGHHLKQPDVSSLRFEYKEFYVPVGMLLNGSIASYWTIGLNLIWMPQVYSAVEIKPLSGANWKIKRQIKNGLAELPITWIFNKRKTCFLQIKPFFEYWEDGKTEAKTQTGFALDVPRNIYKFYGAELNMGWAF